MSPWWFCYLRVSSGASALAVEPVIESTVSPHWERHRLTGGWGWEGGCMDDVTVHLESSHPETPFFLPLLLLNPAVQTLTPQQFWFNLTLFSSHPSPTPSLPLVMMMMMMLSLTGLLFWKHAHPLWLEVWGIGLKDRFLTHGGLALWSRKHKWCGCLSVPLCCRPHHQHLLQQPSLHCSVPPHRLCPCHSLLSHLSRTFTERLEPGASVTVSMGIDFSDSTQAANFQLWWDHQHWSGPRRPTVHLFTTWWDNSL